MAVQSAFELSTSLARAERRLAGRGVLSARKPRSDLGKLRIRPEVLTELRRLLRDDEYPGIESILRRLRAACESKGLPCPSRATVYKVIGHEPGKRYPAATLPEAVTAALYNVSLEGGVPGAQLAFYCFNYGELPALHFAASLPWLALYQAGRMRGWRARSLGLLRAVLAARGIPSV